MNHVSRNESIAWFQQQYRAGFLELRPPFQRKPVWQDKQRHALIESALLDIPIPEVYVQVTHEEDGTEKFGVVDGQQRLRTILQFVGIEREEDQDTEDNNKFSLDSLPASSPFRGITFGELSAVQKKDFFKYEICVRLLYTEDRRDVEDVFKRLNKYTLPLKPQELRNATYHGAFAKLSEELANDEYWAVNRIITPAAIRRMSDVEMMSDLLIGLLHGPQGGSARIIDEYYEIYEQYEDDLPGHAKLKHRFLDTLKVVTEIFPDIQSVPRWGNKADFYSLFVGLASMSASGRALGSAAAMNGRLVLFAQEVDKRLEDPDVRVSDAAQKYARAIEKGSNDKARRSDRHQAMLEVMSPFFEEKTK